jgi:hypothetical protein
MLFLGPVETTFYIRKDMMIAKADVINWQGAAESIEQKLKLLISLIRV